MGSVEALDNDAEIQGLLKGETLIADLEQELVGVETSQGYY